MSRKLAVLALAVGLVACGSEEAERQILLDYVQQMQKLDGKNKQIVETIEHLRKPLSEISEQDLAKARRLINEYVAELQGLVPDDLDYKELTLGPQSLCHEGSGSDSTVWRPRPRAAARKEQRRYRRYATLRG